MCLHLVEERALVNPAVGRVADVVWRATYKDIVATFSDKNFEGGTHQLDDHAYRNCVFRNCRIFYGGGKVNMQDVEFTNCTVELIGAASHTLTLLRNFQNGTCGPGGQTLFNQTFQLQQ